MTILSTDANVYPSRLDRNPFRLTTRVQRSRLTPTTMLVRVATRNSLRPPTWVRYGSALSHSRPQPSAAYFDPSMATDPSVAQTPENLTETQREGLQSALRVDQAGEVAANYIYKGQLAVFQRDPEYGPLIQVLPPRLMLAC